MNINIYQPIVVEIENDFDVKSYDETNTAIVYIGGIEIYRQDAGYIPSVGSYDYEQYCNAARDNALRPLAEFLKVAIEQMS